MKVALATSTTPTASWPGFRPPTRDGSLAAFLKPDLTPSERTQAQVEGWILGVPGFIRAAKERNSLRILMMPPGYNEIMPPRIPE